MGARSAASFRGFDIGLYPHQHPGCYNLLWDKIDKIHTISDDLYQNAIELGLDPKTPFNKITPAINTDFFQSDLLQSQFDIIEYPDYCNFINITESPQDIVKFIKHKILK